MAIEEQAAADIAAGVKLTSRILPDGGQFGLSLRRDDPLELIVTETLRHEGKELPAPAPAHPLDLLHNIGPHGAVGPAIENLEEPLWEYLRKPHTTKDFGVALVLAIRVNKRWAIAPETPMTPKAILAIFALDPSQFSLYLPGESQPLPPDTAIPLRRGDVFEAQKDGKYGE